MPGWADSAPLRVRQRTLENTWTTARTPKQPKKIICRLRPCNGRKRPRKRFFSGRFRAFFPGDFPGVTGEFHPKEQVRLNKTAANHAYGASGRTIIAEIAENALAEFLAGGHKTPATTNGRWSSFKTGISRQGSTPRTGYRPSLHCRQSDRRRAR